MDIEVMAREVNELTEKMEALQKVNNELTTEKEQHRTEFKLEREKHEKDYSIWLGQKKVWEDQLKAMGAEQLEKKLQSVGRYNQELLDKYEPVSEGK